MKQPEQEWLTPGEVAADLQVYRETVIARLDPSHPETIPSITRPGRTRNGDRHYISRAVLEEWRANNPFWGKRK